MRREDDGPFLGRWCRSGGSGVADRQGGQGHRARPRHLPRRTGSGSGTRLGDHPWAGAARVRRPLAQKDERLAVIPASYHGDELPALLEQFETLCLLKVSQALPQLVEKLETLGTTHEVVYVENLGTAAEWITADLREAI